jgi:methyl-galactoside transport system substrate-binding protein
MNILKKLLSTVIVFMLLLHITYLNVYADPIISPLNPVKVAVFLYSGNPILFYSRVKENLENIQKENEDKVQFTFFDSKGNQGIQNDNITKAFNSESFNLFVVTPVSQNVEELQNSIFRITENKIPLIILAPPDPSLTKYLQNSPSVIIGGDDEQSGVLQGELIVETWNSNKETLDKNKDNILQYVMIQGPANDPATLARTKYSIQTINNAGIKTQQLFSIPCSWEYECAKTNMEAILLTFNNKIEALISNNDAMAIGTIETLQKYGYNKEDKSKYISVFGINGLPEADNLINQGVMAGTVIQDPREYANAVYTIGMNLVSDADPLSGTNYKFDETGKIIKIPYHRYTK